MPNSLLLDNIGIDYSEEVDTPREGGMLQAMGLDSSTALAGSPAQPQSEAASLFQQAMGVSQETSKGFFERNDILPTLSDAMKTSINILKSGGPYTKEVQINDPVRKDRLKGWYDEGVNITPYEHMSYMRTGIMPKEVLENITAEREQTEAYIESKGGHLRVISDAISENPSEMALEMGKYIISNPQYLMLPMAYAATAARVAVSTGKTAARTAGVAAEVGVGAGIAAGGAALTTRQQEGIVDPQEVKNAAMVGGGAGFLLGTGQAILRPLKGAGDLVQNKTGIISEDVQAQIIRYSQKHKVSMQVATAKVVENYNLDPYPIVAELNKVAGDLEKTLVPEGPFVGPKTKRQIMQEKVSKKAEAEMAGRDPTASFVENRSVVDVPPEPPRIKTGDVAGDMFTSAAYPPNKGAVTEPIMSMAEFADSPMGRSSSGARLAPATLREAYEDFHKTMIDAQVDGKQMKTLQELADEMAENSPKMKTFFGTQARKLDKDIKDLPPAAKKARKDQQGEVDPRLAATVGIAGAAALIGYSKEHDLETAVSYALAAGGGIFAIRVLRGWLKGRNQVLDHITSPPKKQLSLDKLYNKWQGEGAMRERRILNLRNSLYDISGGRFGGKALREEITTALESGNISKLSPEGQEIAKVVREEFDKIGKEIVKKGLIEESELLENYVAHLWQHPTKSVTELIDDMFGDQPRGLATKSMHEKKRVIPTYAIGEEAGLQPRTKDIADILAVYQKSVDQAQRNTELFHSLKYMKDPLTGKPLVVKGVENAPKTYRQVNHPRFAGHAVHPDLAPAVKSIFNVAEFSAPIRGVQALNFFLKRMAVSLSAFHALALMKSALMAGGLEKAVAHPVNSTKNLINTFRGKSPHLEALRKGELGDEIDVALKNGLVLNTVDDVGSDTFYGSLDDIRGVLDTTTEALGPVLGAPTAVGGKAVGALKASNLWVDGMMWDRIYTGFKISTYLDKMQKLSSRYAGKVSKDQLAKLAAEFTNDAYGGLNWLRLAENVTNRYGRQLAYNLVSKSGRASMQMVGFAPDWTTANVRVFYKAFANKSGMQRKLYQSYQLRGMLMFLVMGNILNNQLSGHNIWENQDPSTIEFGDGTRMVLSKQFMEPYKWLTKPEQEALNKTSTLLSTGLQVMTGKKWLTGPGQYSPPIESNLTHILSKAAPIWAQQGMAQGSLAAGAKSLAGFPTYGAPQGSAGVPTTAPTSPYGGGGNKETVIAPSGGGGGGVFSGMAKTASGILDAATNVPSPKRQPLLQDAAPMPEDLRKGLRDAPRGIANNNPLNIEQGANWQGLSKDQSGDPRFAQFIDPKQGIRAAVKIMKKYKQRGVNTLTGIISTWAPANENNTKAYIDTVSKLSGISPHSVIDLTDETTMVKLIKGMIAVENGHKYGDYYDDQTIIEGIKLAK